MMRGGGGSATQTPIVKICSPLHSLSFRENALVGLHCKQGYIASGVLSNMRYTLHFYRQSTL
jgi:hypothetical protein